MNRLLITLGLFLIFVEPSHAQNNDGPWNPPRNLYKVLWVDTISGRMNRTDSYFLTPAVAKGNVLVLADGVGGTQNHGVQFIGTFTNRADACKAAQAIHKNAESACGCASSPPQKGVAKGDSTIISWWKKQTNTTKGGIVAGGVIAVILLCSIFGAAVPASAKIMEAATKKVGNQDYAWNIGKDNFGVGSNKCNLFVYDCLIEAGIEPPRRSRNRAEKAWDYVWSKKQPIVAGEWGDPAVDIPGWILVKEPLPGDIVAIKEQSARATGHVGIYAGNQKTISAAEFVVEMNDWGFRAGQTRPIFRRYVGTQ